MMFSTVTDLQWCVLSLLSPTMGVTATKAHKALQADWPFQRLTDISAALQQLESKQLAICTDGSQWRATAEGQAMLIAACAASGAAQRKRERTAHELLAEQTPCAPRRALGTGDIRPPLYRPGATDAAALPSRAGNKRRWPDVQADRQA